MTNKHTPAPWIKKGNFIEDQHGYWICALDEEAQCFEETEQANINLILASPDLLEALELLVRFNNSPPQIYYQKMTEKQVLDKAISAINKAKGLEQ